MTDPAHRSAPPGPEDSQATPRRFAPGRPAPGVPPATCAVRLLAAALLAAGGCGAPASDAGDPVLIREEIPLDTVVDARPAALVDGRSVSWGELRPALTELAGAEALRDLVLDRRLSAAVAAAGFVVDETRIAAERRLLLETLDPDPDVAARLLEALRDRRGLGPERFRALLRRTAALRALVADDVRVPPGAVEALHDVRHGPTRTVRVIVVPTLADATDALDAIESGTPFADVAVRRSTDASAARGGLLEPIASRDVAYPESLRRAAWRLPAVGAVSDPVALDRGFAILRLESEAPSDGTALDDVRDALQRLARLEQERIAMDRLARRLVADTTVSPMDPRLRDAWSRFLRRERAAVLGG